jgi:hypothetical protein
MGKENEKILRQYVITYGRCELDLPVGSEVFCASVLHDRPFIVISTDVLLTHHDKRVFHLLEVGRAYERKNFRFINSVFAMHKVFCAFEEVVSS